MALSAIGFAGEHGAGFELFGKGGEGFDVALEVGEDVFAFVGEFEVGIDVAGAADEFFVVGDERFEALAVAHERLASRPGRTTLRDRRVWFRLRLVPCAGGQGQRYSRRSRT